jgi:FkbM family methyltransferase
VSQYTSGHVSAARLPLSLRIKCNMVGSPVENHAKYIRWLLGAAALVRHPDLWELHLEEMRLLQVLDRLLKPTSCAIDVGAHIGSFTNLLLRYSPEGKHLAVEPSLTKSGWLRRKFPQVTIIQSAVTDQCGFCCFEENPRQPGYSRLQTIVHQNNVIRYDVPTIRLDDLDIDRIDLIKLDIEGGELAALQGARNLIRRNAPAIIFECGHQYPPTNTDRKGIWKTVTESIGYDVFTFGDFLFDKGPLTWDEFRKCALYPFRAFNYVALPKLPDQ